ncbi:hypothetical protein GN316_13175 [Xylophilus sp. Kf1]|nr:hypothetical protein [Xylophilus sp. Kf1]
MSGCTTRTSTVVDAVKQVISPPAADTAVLNPAFRYLRTTSGKTTALLVLGYTDATPEAGTQVWYSGDKETIRLWRGRLAGTGGLRTDWRSVRFTDVPTWRAALRGSVSYRRQRDVMPNYTVDIRERVAIVPVAAPAKSSLVNIAPQSLQWFEERTVSEGQVPPLPVARFAVDLSGTEERVIYSEQCLSADLCLTFQTWPATVAASPLPTTAP